MQRKTIAAEDRKAFVYKLLKIMVDIKNGLWSNRPMRSNNSHLFQFAPQTGVGIVARTLPLKLNLLALGSLLALLIVGRGAGTG